MKNTETKTTGQLFIRRVVGTDAPNVYLVCGLIETDSPLQNEAIYTFGVSNEDIRTYNVRSVSELLKRKWI